MSNYLASMTRRMLRASEVSTGAMVALVPAAKHQPLLAHPDGLDPSDLHVTLAYLGKGDDWPAELRDELIDALVDLTSEANPVSGAVWAVADINPGSESECIAYLVEGFELEAMMRRVRDAITRFDIPVQHSPWVPHITVGYGLRSEHVERAAIGSIVEFDAIRVAFNSEVDDIPLGD